MHQQYNEYPTNHAETYSDKPIHPLLAAISGNMGRYANIDDAARYHNHLMPSMQHVADDGTPMQRTYVNNGGGGAGWGGSPTGTGGGTGHSGYGYQHPSGADGGGGYDYHPAAPGHMPTGGSYSPYATAGSGYGAPAPPKYFHQPHPTPAYPNKASPKKKKSKKNSSASTMNALTLLAFFFFINLLQNCLKDNTEAMNPTVMVMTKNVVRNRNSKLSEINSREQSTSPASTFTSGANIVVQPEDLVSAAAGAGGSSITAAAPAGVSVTLQTSPYSDGGGGGGGLGATNAVNAVNTYVGGPNVISNNNQNNNYNNNNPVVRPAEPQYSYGNAGSIPGQQQQINDAGSQISQHNINNNNNNHGYNVNHHFGHVPFSATSAPAIITTNRDPRPDFHESAFPYPNQTLNSATSTNMGHHYQQLNQQHQEHNQHPYIAEQYEQESYEPQFHQPHPKPQIQQQQQSYEKNPFQQNQQQHYHQSHSHGHNTKNHQSDKHEHYQNDHEQPAPQDHFQHHYPLEHQIQQHHYSSIERRPLRPSDGQSEFSAPWSYSPGSSFSNAHKRGSNYSPLSSYTWSSGTLPSRVSGNNNFDNRDDREDDDNDRYEDSFYTRSNRKL